MLVKQITYTDYNEVERKEKFYFNLTEAELTELELTMAGGFRERMQKITDAKDISELYTQFKKLVLMSYGKKSEDGKRLIKTEEVKQEFMDNPAFSKIMMELVTDSQKALDFVNGILPESIRANEPSRQIEVSEG